MNFAKEREPGKDALGLKITRILYKFLKMCFKKVLTTLHSDDRLTTTLLFTNTSNDSRTPNAVLANYLHQEDDKNRERWVTISINLITIFISPCFLFCMFILIISAFL